MLNRLQTKPLERAAPANGSNGNWPYILICPPRPSPLCLSASRLPDDADVAAKIVYSKIVNSSQVLRSDMASGEPHSYRREGRKLPVAS